MTPLKNLRPSNLIAYRRPAADGVASKAPNTVPRNETATHNANITTKNPTFIRWCAAKSALLTE